MICAINVRKMKILALYAKNIRVMTDLSILAQHFVIQDIF
jgi:hypothetical protein